MPLSGSLIEGCDLGTAIIDTDIVLRDGECLVGEFPTVLERLARAWRRHITETEAGDGLLQEIVDHAPRLAAETDRLRCEHRAIAQELRALRLRLVAERAPSPATIDAIGVVVAAMRAHDQTGGSLIWEAYNDDVTGGD